MPYSILHATPSIEKYCDLRKRSGLDAKSEEAASRGLRSTLFAVQVICDGEVVGMGRVVGDDGCFYQVVDIAVAPEHQGKGLGKLIMQEIMKYIRSNAPETAYVSLIADGNAHHLYAKFGFVHTAPYSVGMELKGI